MFTGAQLLNRALVNTVLIVAGIAAVEDAPEGARAFATGMYALALGAGFGLAVVLLPFADLGDYGWRISFAVSAALVLLVPLIAREPQGDDALRASVADRTARRGRVREVFDRAYGARFLLLGLAAFLTNVFSAPSSQLTNRYLTHAHDFSNADVAVFRAVTAGVPGIIGVLLASRLAESRGRRPVTIIGLLVATVFQGAFFLADGACSSGSRRSSRSSPPRAPGLALGTLDAELFPTEVRGTSSGFLLVSGVAGSAVGLVLATQLKSFAGGLGPAIALCGIASLVAAIFVVPRLPETADRRLDDVSPSERLDQVQLVADVRGVRGDRLRVALIVAATWRGRRKPMRQPLAMTPRYFAILPIAAFTFAGAALAAVLNCFTSVLACVLVGCELVVLPILRTAVQNLLLLAAGVDADAGTASTANAATANTAASTIRRRAIVQSLSVSALPLQGDATEPSGPCRGTPAHRSHRPARSCSRRLIGRLLRPVHDPWLSLTVIVPMFSAPPLGDLTCTAYPPDSMP